MFNFKKAAYTQIRLASRVILKRDSSNIKFIGGADCSYDNSRRKICSVIVIYKFPELECIEIKSTVLDIDLPYIPGFLNFREAPAVLRAFRLLKSKPDILFIDGNGIAHPRRLGLASYIGVILNISTIGCAKSPFFPCEMPGPNRGDLTVFRNQLGQNVGYCLRTRDRVKPVLVSPGNRIDIEESKDLVLACSKYRIPEPIRHAHNLAKKIFYE